MQTSKGHHLEHARHNHRLAKMLARDGNYNDWVVTTAYYACNHYVKSRIFPLKDHGIVHLKAEIASHDDYCLYTGSKDRHVALIDLFIDHVDVNKGERMRTLHNDCCTARYNNYVTLEGIVSRALETLDIIAKECDADYDDLW